MDDEIPFTTYPPSTQEYARAYGGYWHGEHPDHPVAQWKEEVHNNDTREGYWRWVMKRAGITED